MLDDGIQVGSDDDSAMIDNGKINPGKQSIARTMRVMDHEEQEWSIVKRKGK